MFGVIGSVLLMVASCKYHLGDLVRVDEFGDSKFEVFRSLHAKGDVDHFFARVPTHLRSDSRLVSLFVDIGGEVHVTKPLNSQSHISPALYFDISLRRWVLKLSSDMYNRLQSGEGHVSDGAALAHEFGHFDFIVKNSSSDFHSFWFHMNQEPLIYRNSERHALVAEYQWYVQYEIRHSHGSRPKGRGVNAFYRDRYLLSTGTYAEAEAIILALKMILDPSVSDQRKNELRDIIKRLLKRSMKHISFLRSRAVPRIYQELQKMSEVSPRNHELESTLRWKADNLLDHDLDVILRGVGGFKNLSRLNEDQKTVLHEIFSELFGAALVTTSDKLN